MNKFSIICILLSSLLFCTGTKAVLIKSGKKQQLHRLSEFGRIDKIKEEYSPGDNINAGNRYGYTPLMIVSTASFASYGHIETFNFLIKNGAQPNTISGFNQYNTIHLAALNPHVLNKYNYTLLNRLLKCGIDINAKNSLGQTPLLLSVISFSEIRKSPDLIKKWTVFFNWLIKNNAQINTKDNNGNTPLSVAKRYNNPELIDLIKKAQ
jgi:cytohesin